MATKFFIGTPTGPQETTSTRFAPMELLIDWAELLDRRPKEERKVWFISPFFREDPINVYVKEVDGTLYFYSLPLSFTMVIDHAQVIVELVDMNFKLTHKVKRKKFNPEKILRHFERCVVDALEQTKKFRADYAQHADLNLFHPVMMDITCTNEVEVMISADAIVNPVPLTFTCPLSEIDKLDAKALVERVWSE